MAASTTHRTRKSSSRPLTFDYVKGVARGRWKEIASQVFGIGGDYLTGKHGPCPKCGGSDRWRFTNLEDSGAAICNKCGRFSDGFKLGDWATGLDKMETLRRVAEFLGVSSSGSRSRSSKELERIDLEPLNELLATYWCVRKPPVTIPSLIRCRAAHGRLRSQEVLALPAYGRDLLSSPPTRYTVWRADGGMLPNWSNKNGKWEVVGQLKSRVTSGGSSGLHGPVDELASPTTTHVWKLEGPTDLLAFYSLPDIPAGHVAITNANGAGEKPHRWMLDLLAGKTVYTLHDADQPGQDGTAAWSTTIAPAANITLPYSIAATHGKDLRDWITEGHTFADLLTLAATATPIEPTSPPADAEIDETAEAAASDDPAPNEAIDDPHRLARVNLERYHALTAGGKIQYWRDEWYIYKTNKYRKIPAKELESKIAWAIKEEFNRANIEAQKVWEEKRKEAAKSDTKFTDERPEARKVTKSLVGNVMQATASMSIISGDIELNSELSTKTLRNWIAMQNGIVDVDAFLDDRDLSEVLKPHTSDWFSVTCLPYEFNPRATCPRWLAFLDRCMGGDKALIAILQEWAGYLLLPDTGQQKFLVNEGEGGNGKSVYMSAIEAMLGVDNCSHVSLEKFAGQFDLTETLGKLANICGDMGEIDKIGEGHLKSFTGGDRMLFNRKNLSGINCAPTARLMFNTNNRPRFSDKSSGIWRRILLIPWNVTITKSERVLRMDQIAWWQESGELPGIFIWAIKGLARLRMQKAFTFSEVVDEAVNSYRKEVNPAREFLLEFCEAADKNAVPCKMLYTIYRKWTEENGNQPMAATVFGREVHRAFPEARRTRYSVDDRHWRYENLRITTDKICGIDTDQYTLF